MFFTNYNNRIIERDSKMHNNKKKEDRQDHVSSCQPISVYFQEDDKNDGQ